MIGASLPQAPSRGRVRLRPLALPVEHGGWALLGGPILLGLLIAPSFAGLWVALAGLGGFLVHQPLRLGLSDLRRGKRYLRTRWALAFAAAYACASAVALAVAVSLGGNAFLPVLVIAAGFGAIQFSFAVRGEGRSLLPEIIGGVALAALAPAIALAGGALPARAGFAFAVLALHAATSIPYVATRLRLSRGERVPVVGPIAGQVGVFWVAMLGWAAGGIGAPLVLVALLLAVRTAWGLSPRRRVVPASIVGAGEIGFILLVVLASL
jgi:hypothetical protein